MFQSDMSLQITFICETFMTLFALVGHTFMSTSDMCLQMTPLGEIFITYSVHIGISRLHEYFLENFSMTLFHSGNLVDIVVVTEDFSFFSSSMKDFS